MAITNYQGGADTIFDYRNINRVAERELGRKASVAQATAKRQEDQAKEIAGMMAKINQDGLRNADIPKFSQKYGDIQNWAAKIRTATTIEERATASAEFNQKVQDIGLFVNRSKNYSKQLQSVAGDYLKDTQGYSEETGTYYKTQYAKPLDDNTDNDNIDISSFKKLGDVKYVEALLGDVYKNVGKVEGSTIVGSTLAASSGTTIKNTNQITQLNRGEIAQKLLLIYNKSWQTRSILDSAYPNAKSPEEKVAAYMIDNRGRETTNNASTINLSNKSAGSGGDGTNPADYGQPIRKEFKSVASADNKKQLIISEQFIGYDGGTVSMPQLSKVYSFTDGFSQTTVPIEGAKVTGIGYFPVKGGKSMKGISVIADIELKSGKKETKELFIPDAQVPYNFKNTKKYRAADTALGERKDNTIFKGNTSKPASSGRAVKGELD
jgi:hypothetical protein